jgi:hypothetical protein
MKSEQRHAPKRRRKTVPVAHPDVRELVWTIAEAAVYLGKSQSATFTNAQLGRIPTIRIGGRILVPSRRLMREFPRSGQSA